MSTYSSGAKRMSAISSIWLECRFSLYPSESPWGWCEQVFASYDWKAPVKLNKLADSTDYTLNSSKSRGKAAAVIASPVLPVWNLAALFTVSGVDALKVMPSLHCVSLFVPTVWRAMEFRKENNGFKRSLFSVFPC